MGKVEDNLAQIQKDIVPYSPRIIAVTKYFDESKLIEAYKAGLRDFAENKVNEAIAKISKLPEEIKQNSVFHLIGHLQSNKVKKAVGNFDYIHSVDTLKLAKLIDEQALKLEINQKILLQVNNSGETTKSGFTIEKLKESFLEIISLKNIKVEGLMTITPLGETEENLAKLFNELYQLKLNLEREYKLTLKELSMGMSQDYKIAIRYNSTMIRIGRKLFK